MGPLGLCAGVVNSPTPNSGKFVNVITSSFSLSCAFIALRLSEQQSIFDRVKRILNKKKNLP